MNYTKLCEFWEQREDVEEKRVIEVKKAISNMHRQLERIEQVLYNENKE